MAGGDSSVGGDGWGSVGGDSWGGGEDSAGDGHGGGSGGWGGAAAGGGGGGGERRDTRSGITPWAPTVATGGNLPGFSDEKKRVDVSCHARAHAPTFTRAFVRSTGRADAEKGEGKEDARPRVSGVNNKKLRGRNEGASMCVERSDLPSSPSLPLVRFEKHRTFVSASDACPLPPRRHRCWERPVPCRRPAADCAEAAGAGGAQAGEEDEETSRSARHAATPVDAANATGHPEEAHTVLGLTVAVAATQADGGCTPVPRVQTACPFCFPSRLSRPFAHVLDALVLLIWSFLFVGCAHLTAACALAQRLDVRAAAVC